MFGVLALSPTLWSLLKVRREVAMVTFSWPARLNRDGDLAWTGRRPTALLADICSPGISGADAKLKCAAARLKCKEAMSGPFMPESDHTCAFAPGDLLQPNPSVQPQPHPTTDLAI